MKLSLKKYESAKKALKDMKVHQGTVSAWEDAVRKVGDVGNQAIVSIEIKDGEVSFQSKLKDNGTPNTSTSSKDATNVSQ